MVRFRTLRPRRTAFATDLDTSRDANFRLCTARFLFKADYFKRF